MVKKKRIQNYLLESKLGKGSFGKVYKATHLISGNVFAVKTVEISSLNSKMLNQLEAEIKTLSSSQHNHIIKLYEVFRTQRNYYLIIEYCGGGDLDQWILRNGPIDEKIAKK